MSLYYDYFFEKHFLAVYYYSLMIHVFYNTVEKVEIRHVFHHYHAGYNGLASRQNYGYE